MDERGNHTREKEKNMRTEKFQTEPFTCPSCVTKIEKVISRQDGVESAQVMFSSSKVKVSFDENLVTAETIAKAISELGYPVLSHKTA